MPSRARRYVARALAAGILVTGLGSAVPTSADVSHQVSWRVSPGVTYREWRFTSPAGPQWVHVVDVNVARPGVSIGYAANPALRMRAPTSRLVGADPSAVAGTNANYFDISDTGAPAGVGRSRTRGVLHAPATGWNNAFYQAADGSYHVGTVALTGQVTQYPTWPLTGLNLPHARSGEITLYTAPWGEACGRCVVDKRHTPVREVRIRDGVVRANTTHMLKGRTYPGYRLVGLGRGADLLKQVAVGATLTPTWALDPKPQMAVTGSQVLVRDGKVVAADDGLVAPRTAIGIDADTGHVLLVALDGRQAKAHGMSLRGWAKVLARMGVDDAINLDGGGSTTMVARGADDAPLGVVNRPSLERERWVPDAVTVSYTAPQ